MLAQPASAVAIAIAKVNFFIFNMDFFLSFKLKCGQKLVRILTALLCFTKFLYSRARAVIGSNCAARFAGI